MGRTVYGALLLAALLMILGLASCGGGGGDTTPGPPSVLHNEDFVPELQVQVVDHRYRIAGQTDDVLDSDPIFTIIASATSSLDVAVPRINRLQLVNTLVNEARSGTRVRILSEKAYYDDAAYKPYYNLLEAEPNIEVRTDLEGLPRVMHSRFLVIDQARVVTGSYTWESTESENTFGDVISIFNTGVAAAFTNQFNQMFVEQHFGVDKRDDTQHSFLLGGGYGMLDVYFGPTDQPRDLVETEIAQSAFIAFSIQQFTDAPLANYLLGWVSSDPENTLIGMFNNIGWLGDNDENLVYDAFTGYAEAPTGGTAYINRLLDSGSGGDGTYDNYDTMNHKLMIVDHGRTNNTPAVIFTTANYTTMGFTLNDEVMLIMRGRPCMNKYWRGLDLAASMPPASLVEAKDAQEFDQIFTMFPYTTGENATLFRAFNDLPCGLVFGQIDNFRRTITIQGTDGTYSDITIDVDFTVAGTLYTGGTLNETPVFGEGVNAFIENEIINPDHRFMMVVPAGEITIKTIVTTEGGDNNTMFRPDEQTITIGPGCVKNLNLQINQATQNTGGSGAG